MFFCTLRCQQSWSLLSTTAGSNRRTGHILHWDPTYPFLGACLRRDPQRPQPLHCTKNGCFTVHEVGSTLCHAWRGDHGYAVRTLLQPKTEPKTAGFTTAYSFLALTNCNPCRAAVEFSMLFSLILTGRDSKQVLQPKPAGSTAASLAQTVSRCRGSSHRGSSVANAARGQSAKGPDFATLSFVRLVGRNLKVLMLRASCGFATMPPTLTSGGAAPARIMGCSMTDVCGSTLFESACLQSTVFGHGSPGLGTGAALWASAVLGHALNDFRSRKRYAPMPDIA